MSDTTQAQLQNAYNLIKAKKKGEATKLLIPIIQADQNNANAWWLLAHTLDDAAKKRQALEQVVRIQPNHQAAQDKLDKLTSNTPADEESPSPVGEESGPLTNEEAGPLVDEEASPFADEETDLFTDEEAGEPDQQQKADTDPTPPTQPVGQQSSKKWFGCFGFVGIAMLVLVLICAGVLAGGYYTLFHTSFLLGQLESLIESNDKVQVEGLSGSISSGFHIDQLLIYAEDDKWSSLEQIDFQFNGVSDLFNNDRLLIEQFTVGSGTIYHHSSTEADGSQSETASNDDEGTQNGGSNSTSSQSGSFPELQITEFALSNLKFINLDTAAESKLDTLAITNFHYKDDSLVNLGEFQITGLTMQGEEFELVNLTGSTSNGFHLDGYRAQDSYNNWSHLDDITFEFNGIQDLIDHKRLVITRISVGPGGELYIPWKDGDTQNQETQAETSNQSKQDDSSLHEVRIDLFLIPDLKLINPETGVEFEIDEISVKDFQFLDGQLQTLGDVVVNAGDIEFKSIPTNYFTDQPSEVVQRQFNGVVRSPIHESILTDISFDIYASFIADNKMLLYANLFDEKLTLTANETGENILTFQQFSPSDYVTWKHGHLPTNLSGELTIQTADSEDQNSVVTISPGSQFQLGQLTFNIETTELASEETANLRPLIEAKHQAEEGEYWCRLYALPDEPYLALELQLGEAKNTPDLFAKVFYNTPYDNLSEDNQQAVTMMVQNAEAIK